MGNTFGEMFRVTTFGESHGPATGCVVDGCPPGIPLTEAEIEGFLSRRKPGGPWASPRKESDLPKVLSGISRGRTLGTPICIVVPNDDVRRQDYDTSQGVFRPGHGDYTWWVKYGMHESGGGRASARETLGRVAAGAVARAFLQAAGNIDVVGWVSGLGPLEAVEGWHWSREQVEESSLRCPDPARAKAMEAYLQEVVDAGDTCGGEVSLRATGMPVGLGEPVFGKLEADLAKAALSLPASRTFAMGEPSLHLPGSQWADPVVMEGGRVRTRGNRAGGVSAGLSSGMPLTFRVGFKPVSSHRKPQETASRDGRIVPYTLAGGRHDPTVLPRAVPIVEAMTWLVLADHWLRARAFGGPWEVDDGSIPDGDHPAAGIRP